MKLLIIGHSVADIINSESTQVIKPGGITYSVAGLISFLNNKDEIYLCSALDDKYSYLFESLYNKINRSFILKTSVMPVVELTLPNEGERDEKYSVIPGKLSLLNIDFDSFDGIYVNMVSGYDISLQQLSQIRKNYKGLIYFDVHTLSRGTNNNLKREFRRIPDFNEWAECIDILQANENEMITLAEKSTEFEIVEQLISLGIKQIVITRGDRGAEIFIMVGSNVKSIAINAIKINSINKIGCGDVFGALYFYNYISTKNFSSALKIANTAAGITTSYSDINEYFKLKNDVQHRLDKE